MPLAPNADLDRPNVHLSTNQSGHCYPSTAYDIAVATCQRALLDREHVDADQVIVIDVASFERLMPHRVEYRRVCQQHEATTHCSAAKNSSRNCPSPTRPSLNASAWKVRRLKDCFLRRRTASRVSVQIRSPTL